MLKIYGYSDDLVEIEGHITDEVDLYDQIATLTFSDGTVAEVRYGDNGVWKINVIEQGSKFNRLETCLVDDGKADYSDVLYMDDDVRVKVAKRLVKP